MNGADSEEVRKSGFVGAFFVACRRARDSGGRGSAGASPPGRRARRRHLATSWRPPRRRRLLPRPSRFPPAPPPAPPGKPLFDPKIGVGAWLRVGFRIQNPSEAGRLNDAFMDQLYLVLAARGQFTPWLKWQASLAANHYTPPGSVTLDAELTYPNAGLQDLIIKFEPHDFFNVWAGKMILPLDRANLSGPWFTNYWLMRVPFRAPRRVSPAPYGIKSGPFGREQGVTAWGQFWDGQAQVLRGRVRASINRAWTPIPCTPGACV